MRSRFRQTFWPFLPSLEGLYVWMALALTALKPLLTPIPPYDFWWHLAMGRQILQQGQIPTTDTFSFTRAGVPFYNHSWLAQVMMYGLHHLGGPQLLLFFQAGVVVLAYGLLLWLAVRLTENVRLAVLLLLLVVEPISYSNWQVRPQSYALPLFAAFFVILTGYRLRWWRHLWPLPPLMAIWANMHGSFVLGLLLVALVLGGEWASRRCNEAGALGAYEWRRLAFWGALTALAVAVNPRGLAIFGYVLHLVGSPAVTQLVTEWASPTPHDLEGALFFFVVLFFFAALIYARQKPRLADLVLVLPFLWLALMAGRNVIWFAMVALPPLATALAGHWAKPQRVSPGCPVMNGAIAALLAGFVVFALPWVKPHLGLPDKWGAVVDPETPVGAVAFLRTLPAKSRPRRLFHGLGAGSYLIWAAPEQRVFIDPRIELYPYEQLVDAIRLSNGDRIEEIVAQYAFDGLLLSRKEQTELVKRVSVDPRWRLVYRDARWVLFLLADGERQSLPRMQGHTP